MAEAYETLQVERKDGIVWVTFYNPPINLLDMQMIREVDRLSRALELDKKSRVVVFQSADPEFFIAHADVELIRQLPDNISERPTELNIYVAALERLRKLPMATIGKIAGIARGGGSEFLLSLDMRFAAIGPTRLGQPEVAIGILPSGSGSVRLPSLMGRSRALEVSLGCADFSAELAERYGYINRALPDAELDEFVEDLARRIASFPRTASESAKQAADAAIASPKQALLEEAHQFNRLLATGEAKSRMKRFLALGAQTRQGELELNGIIEKLAD
jgi:enoyl-CoA hydratase/carnithine racemase